MGSLTVIFLLRIRRFQRDFPKFSASRGKHLLTHFFANTNRRLVLSGEARPN